VDRHRECLLAEPAAHGIDVGASFDQQRADRVAQAVERQAVGDESLVLQPRDRFDECRVEPARRPRRAYAEGRPDIHGYVANPAGPSFVDLGVGNFLSSGHQLSHPSAVDARWLPLVSENNARFQVPTLRNVDKRPYPAFVKAYGHNGYFKSLKSIVHFYNTRDVLPRCQANDPGEGTACWPPPESTENINTKRVGRLGLAEAEEDALVAFMQTLTDGFTRRDFIPDTAPDEPGLVGPVGVPPDPPALLAPKPTFGVKPGLTSVIDCIGLWTTGQLFDEDTLTSRSCSIRGRPQLAMAALSERLEIVDDIIDVLGVL
jgi:hypothetical protein